MEVAKKMIQAGEPEERIMDWTGLNKVALKHLKV